MLLFSISPSRFSLCTSIIFLRLVSHFMTITFNYLSCRLLIFTSLSSFSGTLLCSSILSIFLSFHFACLCVWLYVLGKIATSLSLWGVILCSTCLCSLEAHSPLSTRASHSMGFPYVCCLHPHAVVGLQLMCGEGGILGIYLALLQLHHPAIMEGFETLPHPGYTLD